MRSRGCVLLLLLRLADASSAVTVTINANMVLQGITDSTYPDVAKFLGVPYGANARWKSATMVTSWTGTKKVDGLSGDAATKCMEIPSPAGSAPASGTGEDCLHLNIYASDTALTALKNGGSTRYPVWVFFHGGGHTQGSPEQFPCQGTLAAVTSPAPFVCVTVAYRLGVFAYANAGEVLAANVDGSGKALGGNLGIQDQRLALQWIQSYIGAFAGDSTKVMISGQSSGGASVIHHLIQNTSWPYYQYASIESGANNLITDLAYANSTWASLLTLLGCSDLACALGKSASAVQNASSYVSGKFWPSIDLVTVMGSPADLIAAGKYNTKVPIIIGTVRDEWYFFMSKTNPAPSFSQSDLDSEGPDFALITSPTRMTSAQWTLAKAAYAVGTYDYPTSLGPTAAGVTYTQAWWTIQRMLTDRNSGHCSARLTAKHFVAGGTPAVYMYMLINGTDATPDPTGHTTCNSFLFPSSSVPALAGAEIAMSTAMIQYWVNFATTGNPNKGVYSPSVQWPTYNLTGANNDTLLKLQTADFVQVQTFRKQACDFWDQYFLPYNFQPYYSAGTTTSTSTTAGPTTIAAATTVMPVATTTSAPVATTVAAAATTVAPAATTAAPSATTAAPAATTAATTVAPAATTAAATVAPATTTAAATVAPATTTAALAGTTVAPAATTAAATAAPLTTAATATGTTRTQAPKKLGGSWMKPGGSLLDLLPQDTARPSCPSGQSLWFNASYSSLPAYVVSSFSCIQDGTQVSCGAGALPTPCLAADSVYVCVPAVLPQCPVVCVAGNKTCIAAPYTSAGVQNFTAPKVVSCTLPRTSCPCDPTWESLCSSGEGESYCLPLPKSCPLKCGGNVTCTSWNKSQSCGNAQGCVCDPAYELPCPGKSGLTECKDLRYYKACPLQCPNGTLLCPRTNFTAAGSSKVDQVCAAADPNTGACPAALCGDGAVICTSAAGGPPSCRSQAVGCDLTCPAGQKMCQVTNFWGSARNTTSSSVCAPQGSSCPCGSGSQTCINRDGSFSCIWAGGSCPTTCNPLTQQLCSPVSYTPSGRIAPKSAFAPSCAALGASCPCGANAMGCSGTDQFGLNYSICQAVAVDGVAQACPVTCAPGQTSCQVVNYNASGYPTSYSQQCVSQGTPCPCGTGAQLCSGSGSSVCSPTVDPKTGNAVSCPVYCNPSTQDTCNVPSYDANGNAVGISSACVPKGAPCPCSLGLNARQCNYTAQGKPFPTCIWSSGYCPGSCPAGQVSCPQVDNFLPAGQYRSTTAPRGDSSQPLCASRLSSCGCGDEARACPWKGSSSCVSNALPCPLDCPKGTRVCSVTNYNSTGASVATTQMCVAQTSSCPCGTNAGSCPGQSFCLPLTTIQQICPCNATQQTCFVVDYDLTGTPAASNPVCVTAGAPCPCGANTNACPSPLDASVNICRPKISVDGQTGCPMPCTPSQEAAGKQTCVQVNLDSSGNYVSQTVSCVALGTCQPGQNMKLCPSGAIIAAGAACVDLYGLTSTASSNASIGVAAQAAETSTVVWTMSIANGASLGAKSNRVGASLASALQLPPSLSVSLNFLETVTTSRRLLRSLAETASVQTVLTVQNLGSSPVSPATVANTASQMVSTGNPTFTSALSTVGEVVTTAGVSVSTETKTVQTRSETALAVAAAQAAASAETASTTVATPSMVQVTTTTSSTSSKSWSPFASAINAAAGPGGLLGPAAVLCLALLSCAA